MDDPHVLKRAIAASVGLAFVAGFADAATFVGADGIFCAHVTGNFVVLAADLARGARADELLKLATFPIFVVSVLVATAIHRRTKPRSSDPILALSAVFLVLAGTVALLRDCSASGAARSAVVALLVTAMAFQNAMHRVSPALGPMTTVMTGNVTGFLVELLIPPPPEARSKHRLTGFILVAFTAGCAAGAVSVAKLGFGVMLVPAAIVFAVRAAAKRL